MEKFFNFKMVIIAVVIANILGCIKESELNIIEKQAVVSDSIVLNDSSLNDSISPIDTIGIDKNFVESQSTNVTSGQLTYYVSVTGSDSNPGDINKPFKTIRKAISVAKAGVTIYVRGGVYTEKYSEDYSIYLSYKSGTSTSYIKLWAYPGEVPIIDGSGLSKAQFRAAFRMQGCNYWHIKGFEFRNVKQYVNPTTGIGTITGGFRIQDSNNSIFENLTIHDIQGIAMLVRGNCNGNIIKNCDFYNNYDPYTYISGVKFDGGNADGINVNIPQQGNTLTIEGCRMWWNSDDGIDCYSNNATITIKNCWAFWNGFKPGSFISKGDGNGFKLGPNTAPALSVSERIVINCIAAENGQCGFDNNLSNCKLTLYNNTSFKNQTTGFQFYESKQVSNFRNNIGYKNKRDANVNTQSINDHNSWNNGYTVSDKDFVSVSSVGMNAKRGSSFTLPVVNFLKLTSVSKLRNAGVNVGLPFTGKAPDMGVYF